MECDKVFNDPIHNSIQIPPYCQLIIDTPEFQRLRFIKQLGCTCYVFPSAVHTRFEHSIGVSHLAGKLATVLKQNNPKTGIQDIEITCVKIAGLCHDLGHGPFSHAFEDIVPRGEDGEKWTHEKQSVIMFEHLIEQNDLKEKLAVDYNVSQQDIDFICEIIQGRPRGKGSKLKDKFYLHQIVNNSANGVDVDKWDYFSRDTLYLGMKSAFDFNRIMPHVKVFGVSREGGKRKELCFRDKVASDLNHMFLTRRRLHFAAYKHRVSKIITVMLTNAFLAASDYLKFVGSDGLQYNLLQSVKNPKAFCQVNDTIVNEIMRSPSQEPAMKKAQEIIDRIHKRQIYQCIGEYHHHEEIHKLDTAEIKRLILTRERTPPSSSLSPSTAAVKIWSEENIQVEVSNFHYGGNDKNPLLDIPFYTKANEGIIFLTEEKLPVDQPRSLQDTRVSIYYTKLPMLTETDLKEAKQEGNRKLKEFFHHMTRSPTIQRKRTTSAPSLSGSGKSLKRRKTNEEDRHDQGEASQEESTTRQCSYDPSTSFQAEDLPKLSQQSQVGEVSEKKLFDIAEDLGNHPNLDKLAFKLDVNHAKLLQYKASNTRRDGQVCSDGTRTMLMDWKMQTRKQSHVPMLRSALIAAGFLELAEKYLG